jgi:hypothetical protein
MLPIKKSTIIFLLFLTTLLCFKLSSVFAQNHSVIELRTEYMTPDSLLIMGSLQTLTMKESLISTLGEPDSIVTVREIECPNYFNRYCPNEYERLYWGNSHFEVCNDKAVVSVIYFSENEDINLIYKGEIELSHRTTVDYIRQYFPNTVKKLGDIKVYQESTYQSFTLPVQPERAESGWMFFFRDDKLKRLDYWFPC